MDIFIPIGIGPFTNLLVFIISKAFKQTNQRSLQISFFSFLAVLLASFIIGAWIGMGIAVISSGMLIFVILASIITTRLDSKNSNED
ncbi:hypothetical protein [Sporosarcina ureae]|uniref:hypothetical protein n=1 Tax=Sporosarcina ureae TaxID=1571 RepID=UPI0009DC55C8|nr:hypothetical protein [Sporosarcina ureae]ARF16672.1 hypothetical protein SporoP17a_04820 [Sporosarcina ureae]